jgi:hypothetical protein
MQHPILLKKMFYPDFMCPIPINKGFREIFSIVAGSLITPCGDYDILFGGVIKFGTRSFGGCSPYGQNGLSINLYLKALTLFML